jgi:hypothetical protein
MIRDPFTGNPFQGDIIPASQLNPASLKIQDLFTPSSFRKYFGVFRQLSRNHPHPFEPHHYWTARIDSVSPRRVSFTGGIPGNGRTPVSI